MLIASSLRTFKCKISKEPVSKLSEHAVVYGLSGKHRFLPNQCHFIFKHLGKRPV